MAGMAVHGTRLQKGRRRQYSSVCMRSGPNCRRKLGASSRMRSTIRRRRMQVSSTSFKDGDYLSMDHVLSADYGFGCSGGNQSPHLKWDAAPPATKSYAVTCFDPDASTGSGFWHWLVVNIPRDVNEL